MLPDSAFCRVPFPPTSALETATERVTWNNSGLCSRSDSGSLGLSGCCKGQSTKRVRCQKHHHTQGISYCVRTGKDGVSPPGHSRVPPHPRQAGTPCVAPAWRQLEYYSTFLRLTPHGLTGQGGQPMDRLSHRCKSLPIDRTVGFHSLCPFHFSFGIFHRLHREGGRLVAFAGIFGRF